MSHFLTSPVSALFLTEPQAHWVSLGLARDSQQSGTCDHNCLLQGLGGLGSKLGSSDCSASALSCLPSPGKLSSPTPGFIETASNILTNSLRISCVYPACFDHIYLHLPDTPLPRSLWGVLYDADEPLGIPPPPLNTTEGTSVLKHRKQEGSS